eukprot:9496968-Pyramimonas_sp.AAC.1
MEESNMMLVNDLMSLLIADSRRKLCDLPPHVSFTIVCAPVGMCNPWKSKHLLLRSNFWAGGSATGASVITLAVLVAVAA